MKPLVIDTSVLVKWFLTDEELAGRAKSLLRAALEGTVTLFFPLLAHIEFGNVLKTQKSVSLEQKILYLSDLFALPVEILEYNQATAIEALRLCHEYDLSYYDASFVALARVGNYDFITADRSLHRKLRSLPFVHYLGDIEVNA